MKDILFIFGTRPEAVKLAPVILALRERGGAFRAVVCNTEQQKEMSNQALACFGLEADLRLDVMRRNQTLHQLQARLLERLDGIFAERDVAAAVVQGDTMSVFCGALAAFYRRRPVFHVEAGLRSRDLAEPFPEEALRCMVSRIANLHFAPTSANRDHLLAEGIAPEIIHVTGNTVVDAMRRLSPDTASAAAAFFRKRGVGRDGRPTALATVHRRENHGERLDRILAAIDLLALSHPELDFVIPVHPNPNVKERVHAALAPQNNVFALPPLGYAELVHLLRGSRLILTDSGGIQEEANSLGRRILVLRYKTERMEGVLAGLSELVGADTRRIVERAEALLSSDAGADAGSAAMELYGDGRAGERIVDLIERYPYPGASGS